MKNFEEKYNELIKIKEELNDHIWTIFERYLDIKK